MVMMMFAHLGDGAGAKQSFPRDPLHIGELSFVPIQEFACKALLPSLTIFVVSSSPNLSHVERLIFV